MSTPRPRALIFDLDDTLVQTAAASSNTWAGLAREFADALNADVDAFGGALDAARKWFWDDPARHLEWRLRMGESSAEVLRLASQQLGINVPDDMPERFAERYVERFFASLDLFPDALDVLNGLRTQGVKLAMITNGGGPWQRRKINRHALDQWFGCILVEGEFGVGKPAPATYRHVLKTLDVAPEHTWMVGDRLDWDVLAPQQLGITGVWFDFALKGLPAKRAGEPDRVIRSLSELLS